ILTCLVPKWFVAMFGGSLSFGRRLVPVALIAIIFPGTILHPLSDLPALLLAWGGLYCIYRAKAARGVSRWALFAWLVGAGILSGAASNTRTIYMFMIPASMLLAALLFPRARMACVSAAVAGLALASLPQAAFNLKVNKEFNPMVIVPMGQNSLFVVHLLVGVTTQRYETSYLFGGFAYRDPAGEQLAKKLRVHQPLPAHADLLAGIAPTVHISDYLQMVGKYPLEFLGIYARHAVNGLDVRDGRSYVKTFSARRNAISVFNFLVLALAAWTLLAHRSEQARAGPTQGAAPFWWVGLLALLLPVAAILPGVVETRFFLPLHLLAYCVIAFHCRPQGWWTQAKSHPLWLLVTTVIACLYFSIVLSAMAQG
ncbi:MAG TPA: hypothetical protein VLJ57_02635, partial [Burkholderiaceae bacterium]|nr:hypothetical protein [Burkholderiaceae bacterium]